MALPSGGNSSDMGSCEVCPSSLSSSTIYQDTNDDGSCGASWSTTFYPVDGTTGCGACPPGKEPWQFRSITGSKYAGLVCSQTNSNVCYLMNGDEFPQTDCTTSTCGARYFLCMSRAEMATANLGEIECSPSVTHDTAWLGGMSGMIVAVGGGMRPMECIKRAENSARIYDTRGLNSGYNERYMVTCSVWKVISCTYDASVEKVRCDSASRTKLVKAVDWTPTTYYSVDTMPVGMQELDQEAGLCSPVTQSEG